MKYHTINLKDNLAKDTIYCLGFFDGLHLGHQELIKKTIELAKLLNKNAGILTFNSKLPTKVNKHNANKLLITYDDKNKLLKSFNLDLITYLEFDEECKKTSKEDFIDFLKNELNCVGTVVGNDYRFGYKGEGDSFYLKQIESKDFIVSVVSPLSIDNEVVSTTKIIEYLQVGNIEKVNKYLGRNYSLSGIVKEGFHVGKTLEFPTANIEINDTLFYPLFGVYGVKVSIDDKEYLGIANLGIRPSINTLEKPLLETNIFEYEGNLYNKQIKIEFIYFIRSEKKFESIQELKDQIKLDKEKFIDQLKKIINLIK